MTNTTQYKNTPIGPIPIDWEVKKLGDLVEIRSGNSPSDFNLQETGKYPYLKVEDLNNCFKYQLISREYTDDSFKNIIEVNSLIFPKRGAAIINNKIRVSKVNCYLDSNLMALKIINQDKLDLEYLYYKILDVKLFKIADTSSIPQLNNKHINPFIIPLPPLPEQQKIAEVLSTWDKAIQETDAIIKNLEQRNKALAFSLLTGKKRVKGFEGKEFKKSLANEVFKSISIKNNPEDSILLSATQEYGMIPRDMIESRVTMPSGSLKTYKLVEKGNFVISLRSFQGGIEYSEYTGVVSPAYTVLKSINPINDDFYKYYFKSQDLIGRLSVAVIGIRDGKNISYDDFSTIVLPNPTLEEQNAIAEILNTANQEVKQYQEKLAFLKHQKKGLMQQLLTGKVRTV